MISEEDVINALKKCQDPEIPINIYDLGLIYDIAIDSDQVNIKMTLTQKGCPMHSAIKEDAKKKILEIPGVKDVSIDIVWDPPWNQDMISDEGKETLGLS